MNEKRHPGGLIPQGKFLPVLLFANVKSVIAPEHDNRVVFHRRSVECIKQATKLVIHVTDAREVALHKFLPLLVVGHPLVPALSTMTVRVLEIIGPMLGQFHFIKRIQIEPSLRHFPRNVWPEQTNREKERLISGFLHLLDRPIGDEMIPITLFRIRQRCRAKKLAIRVATKRAALRQARLFIGHQFRSWPISGDGIERITTVRIPCIRVVLRIARRPLQRVKNLASAHRAVAVIAEVL